MFLFHYVAVQQNPMNYCHQFANNQMAEIDDFEPRICSDLRQIQPVATRWTVAEE